MTSLNSDAPIMFDFDDDLLSFDVDEILMESTEVINEEIDKEFLKLLSFSQNLISKSSELSLSRPSDDHSDYILDLWDDFGYANDEYLQSDDNLNPSSFTNDLIDGIINELPGFDGRERESEADDTQELFIAAQTLSDRNELGSVMILSELENGNLSTTIESGNSVDSWSSRLQSELSSNSSLDSGCDTLKSPIHLEDYRSKSFCEVSLDESNIENTSRGLKRYNPDSEEDSYNYCHRAKRMCLTGNDHPNKKSTRLSCKKKEPHSRFQSNGFITLKRSNIQCLSVELDYHNFTGLIDHVVINNNLTNYACHEHDVQRCLEEALDRISEPYHPQPNEVFDGAPQHPIGLESGVLQRKIYFRDLSSIKDMVSFITYERSERFHVNRPYEPQFIRYELDEENMIVTESKCGLCSYCPKVNFYPFKNSTYLSHLSLMHGIFPNNFVVPEGLYVGLYQVSRSPYSKNRSIIEALKCPVCFEVIPIRCWKTKANPLLSYFRHFKKSHQRQCRSLVQSRINPLSFGS